MKITRSASGLFGLAMLFGLADGGLAQWTPEVRRARPIEEPPVARALPFEEPPTPAARRSTDEFSESGARESEAPDRRQLDYANALFTRKLYDLAIPEYQKYLDDYPGRSGRANAYFSIGECYRNLNRSSSARTNFQKVLSDYSDSDFAGPAAYALAETAFTQKFDGGIHSLWAGQKNRCVQAIRSSFKRNAKAGFESGGGCARRHTRSRPCASG